MGNIKKNIVYQIIYRVITILTPLITSPILSRALGAEKLGIYSATLAFVNYFMLFAMLGVENYGNRSIAAVQHDKNKIQELFWNIYAIQFTASVISIISYSFAFVLIEPERYLIALLQGLWLISNLLNVNWYFFGIEQFRLTATRSIFVKVLTVTLIVLFVNQPSDLFLYTLIMGGDAVLSSAIMWPFLLKKIGFIWRISQHQHLKILSFQQKYLSKKS